GLGGDGSGGPRPAGGGGGAARAVAPWGGGAPARPFWGGARPPPPPATGGLALAARAMHHTSKDIRQSHVCLLVLMSDAAPSKLSEWPTATGVVMVRWSCLGRE